MLNSRTWRFLLALSCATTRFVNPAYATETEPRRLAVLVVKSPARSTEAAISPSEAGGALQEGEVLAEPFGLPTEKVLDSPILSRWLELEDRLREENDILASCDEDMSSCPRAARLFLAFISEASANRGRRRIGILNREINLAIHPTSDLSQWGVPDRWSTPLETLSTGRGDCEDYAIAKYVALIRAGLRREDVRLVVVRDHLSNEDHALVATRLDGEWIILDNRRLALARDIALHGANPLFVLDHAGVRRFLRD
jgi:predicted transglutaminase-like cysteine proteinase